MIEKNKLITNLDSPITRECYGNIFSILLDSFHPKNSSNMSTQHICYFTYNGATIKRRAKKIYLIKKGVININWLFLFNAELVWPENQGPLFFEFNNKIQNNLKNSVIYRFNSVMISRVLDFRISKQVSMTGWWNIHYW